MDTIVVGVDGSTGADKALRFAADEARLREAELRLVTAWHVPAAAYGGIGIAVIDAGEAFENDANQCLDEKMEGFATELAGIRVQRITREGRAASVLVEESRDAALLVVGSRGHGGFVGLLAGSVSSECAHHSHCPVVIVPAGDTARE